MRWAPTKVSEIGEIFDGPHATPTRLEQGSKYFLNISSLENGHLNLDHSDFISDEEFARWTRRVTPTTGDLLFSYETRLGDAAIMPSGVEACLGRRMALIRPDRSVVDPRFLLYAWRSQAFRDQIATKAIHGATVSRIPLKELGNWEIMLPSLDTQRAIAEILGALDDKIAVNRRVLAYSSTLLAALWESVSHASKTTPTTLGDLAEINPRTKIPSGQEVPFLDMKNLPENGLLVPQWEHRDKATGAKFKNGDTLLARITPCFENRKMGWVDFLGEDAAGAGSTEYIVFRAKPGIPEFLPYLIIRTEDFHLFASKYRTGTSGRQRVQAKDLAAYPVNLPTGEALADLVATGSVILARAGRARDENTTLARTRDELLPLLMSGRITIKDAEKRVEEEI